MDQNNSKLEPQQKEINLEQQNQQQTQKSEQEKEEEEKEQQELKQEEQDICLEDSKYDFKKIMQSQYQNSKINLSEIQVPPRMISVHGPTQIDPEGLQKEQYQEQDDIQFHVTPKTATIQKRAVSTYSRKQSGSFVQEYSEFQQQSSNQQPERSKSFQEKIQDQFQRNVDWDGQQDRQVPINSERYQGEDNEFKDNTIQTTKYTWFNFLFLNLFEQFRRFSNFYFLVMGLLEMIPQITTTNGIPVIYVPLVFIIVLTAIKDFIEDRKRSKSDRKENEAIILRAKTRSQIFQERYQQKSIQKNTEFSSRTKLFHSSINVSGDNKSPMERQSFPLLKKQTLQEQSQFRKMLNYVPEDNDIYTEVQSQKLRVGDIIKVRQNEPIPADMILLYTSNSSGLVYLETQNLDGETNLKIKAPQKKLLDIYKSELDCAQVDGNLVYEHPNPFLYKFQGVLFLDQQQKDKDQQNNNSSQLNLNKNQEKESVSLNQENILLRGCSLKNTKFVVGMVCYTGHETKILLNANNPRSKRSKVESMMNKFILYIISIQVSLCMIQSILNIVWYKNNKDILYYIGTERSSELQNDFIHTVIALGIWVLLLMNLIPISLLITLDFVRVAQSLMLMNSKNMESFQGIKAKVQCSNLNEDLGQIQCIFSDKTGTLTCNIMNFKCIWFDNSLYFGQHVYDSKLQISSQLQNNQLQNLCGGQEVSNVIFQDEAFLDIIKQIDYDNQNSNINIQLRQSNQVQIEQQEQQRIVESLICLSGCHSILIDNDTKEYQAQSPDELALINFAKFCGYEFKGINITNILTIYNHIKEENIEYKLEYVLEFNSDRKRMSIIAKDVKQNKIYMFSKGADNVMLKRCDLQKKDRQDIDKALNQYASQGLRTLVLAKKEISKEELKKFHIDITKASEEMKDREEKMESVMDEIEQNLQFLCLTAIEDKLQDEVENTIEKLKETSMGFWILTGDKLETAISIGYSTKVITQDDELIILDYQKFKSFQTKNNSTILENEQKKNQALVIQGDALSEIFENQEDIEKFSEITGLVNQVIACRVSPKQKKEIVAMYKKCHPEQRVLSIGDGANDVNMINEAHIGIGINGQEGVQAARASDFSIGEFKLLQPLLLYYGREYYRKNTIVINYNFYKNILYLFPNVWFAMASGFGGSNIYDVYLFQLFNACYCALPIIFYAVMDTEFSIKVLSKNPTLYKQGQVNCMFNTKVFVEWVVQGILHACIITFVALYGTQAMQGGQYWLTSLEVQGQVVFFSAILVSNLKVALQHNQQILICWIISILSSLFYVLTLYLSSKKPEAELFAVTYQFFSGLSNWLVMVIILSVVFFTEHGIQKWRQFKELQKIKQSTVFNNYIKYSQQTTGEINLVSRTISFNNAEDNQSQINKSHISSIQQPLITENAKQQQQDI